jgi:AraC-like DNA-binding protein
LHWAQGKCANISRGDVLLLHPNVVHGYEKVEKLSLFNVLFEPEKLPIPILDATSMELFNSILNPLFPQDNPHIPVVHLPESIMTKIESILFDLQEELSQKALGKELRVFALFINLITLICRYSLGEKKKEDKAKINPDLYNVTLALKYAKNHFKERPKVDVLAQIANMSRRDFYRKFEEFTGVTPKRFIMLQALEKAEYYLRKTQLSLQEISYECGFCDSNHFAKAFKDFYQVSPGQYREKLK